MLWRQEGHEVWRVSEPSFLSFLYSLKQNKNFVILSCTCQNLIKPQDVDFRSRQPNTEQTLTWSLDTSQKVWIKLIKCKGYPVTLVQTSLEMSWDLISFRVAQRHKWRNCSMLFDWSSSVNTQAVSRIYISKWWAPRIWQTCGVTTH